jgi:anti-sigma factor RsiW
MRFRDSHPSDRELVLAADGELSARRMEQLRRHLAACWECRVRTQELEGAIGEFVRLHRRDLDPK